MSLPNMADMQTGLKAAGSGSGTGVQTVGELAGGFSQASALRSNANAMTTEGMTAARQGSEQEMQQRRRGTSMVGSMTAAAGQAGAGYGGSTGRAIQQSAVNTELDALNVRYKSQLQKWSYLTQAQNLRSEATTTHNSGLLRAGAALLKGYSGNYTGTARGLYAGNGVSPNIGGLA